MVIKYERVGDYVSAKVDATPEEIAALVLVVQGQQDENKANKENIAAIISKVLKDEATRHENLQYS